MFPPEPTVFWMDLLNPEVEESYSLKPSLLEDQCNANPNVLLVVVDEVQKVPKLLDVVHGLIELKKIKFALTGSSARKLKLGGDNLLAGRAFINSLFSHKKKLVF